MARRLSDLFRSSPRRCHCFAALPSSASSEGLSERNLIRGFLGLLCLLIGAAQLLAGCATPGRVTVAERYPGPVAEGPVPKAAPRQAVHTVKRGDTLHSISRSSGVSVRTLARLNGLRPPYRILPGQKLRLNGRAVAARSAPRRSKAGPKPSAKPSASRPATSQAGGLTWRWPTSSRVVNEYGGTNKGLDFAVRPGTQVLSAADGEVVYAGAGLAGFERLVIVRHNTEYLSAYSVNQPIIVKEKQRVKGGQPIAAINGGGRAAQALHFEIRRNGKPISPRSVLK